MADVPLDLSVLELADENFYLEKSDSCVVYSDGSSGKKIFSVPALVH